MRYYLKFTEEFPARKENTQYVYFYKGAAKNRLDALRERCRVRGNPYTYVLKNMKGKILTKGSYHGKSKFRLLKKVA